jgi:hypothetical protein
MVRISVLALLCLVLSGCVVVPADRYDSDHRYGYHGYYHGYDRDDYGYGYGYRDHGG